LVNNHGRDPARYWWLERATVDSLTIVLTAAVYVGFAGGYGLWTVLLVESGVAAVFVVVAATAIVGPVCLLVAGYAGHGFKDLCSTARVTLPIQDGGPRFAVSSTGSQRC
jgi:uncharacterized membrane protein YedE/YeeE